MIKDLWIKHKLVITYLFWGVVTMVINLAVFQILSPGLRWGVALATVIAWFVSVLVAYFTSKVWVFGSHYTTASGFIVEIFRLFFYRGSALLIGLIITYVGTKVPKFDTLLQQFIVKFIDNAIVVTADYIFSKWLIFKDNHDITDK